MNAPLQGSDTIRHPSSGQHTAVVSVLLALLVAGMCFFVYQKLGLLGLVFVSGALALGSVFAVISAKFLAIPVMIWFISLMGFRTLFMLRTPGLPDISLDRSLLLWILLVFLIRSVFIGKGRQRYEPLDALLVVHALYLLASILMRESPGMNAWTHSYLMGYSAYFVAKYIVAGRWSWIQRIFALLAVLNVYHGVTGIAEHFHYDALIWPKTILQQDINRSFASRSSGVFMQPGVYGTMMGMQLPYHIYFMHSIRNVYGRALLYLTFPVVLLGFYYCYTRGSWIAGIVAILTLGFVGRRQYLPLVARLALVGLLVLGTGVINLKKDQFFNERMGTEQTITGRIGTLGRAYRVFVANPLFGCGFFRYNAVKAEYMGTMDVPFYGVIKRTHDVESTLHDMYIGALAEEGLVGVTLLVAIWWQMYRIFRRKWALRKLGDRFAIYAMPILAGTIVGYFAGGIAFDYRFFAGMGSLLFLSVGLIAGYELPEQAGDAAGQEPATVPAGAGSPMQLTPRV
jgi:hypothetical protein